MLYCGISSSSILNDTLGRQGSNVDTHTKLGLPPGFCTESSLVAGQAISVGSYLTGPSVYTCDTACFSSCIIWALYAILALYPKKSRTRLPLIAVWMCSFCYITLDNQVEVIVDNVPNCLGGLVNSTIRVIFGMRIFVD